jgi:hypothetical protein
MAKQTTVTIETESLLILQARSSSRLWCPVCAAPSEMIGMEKIGVMTNLERNIVEEWLNSADLHRSQSIDGSTLICLNSLLARVQNPKLPGRTAAANEKESK